MTLVPFSRFFAMLTVLLVIPLAQAAKNVSEGVFVNDPSRAYLKLVRGNPDLVIDHMNSGGYEVFGPSGLKSWLSNAKVPFTEQAGIDKDAQNYPTPEQVEAELKALADAYPQITQLINIGKTTKGRNLLVLKISDNPTKDELEPEFKYISSMHGDEITGRQLMLKLVADLLKGYSSDQAIKGLIDNTEIYIMASMNPDGSALKQRGNGNNVDLNRDFPDFSTSDNQNTTQGRQLETQAIMKFQSGRQFALSANFHGGAEVVNYPWDTQGERHPQDALLQKICLNYADLVSYLKNSSDFKNGITNGYDWYEVDGGMQDWSYHWYNDLQITIELSDVKWPNFSEMDYFYKENKTSLINFIKTVHLGAGFKLQTANLAGSVKISRLVDGQYKPEFTHDFRGSEFYKVMEPGKYKFEITTQTGSKTFETEVLATAPYSNYQMIQL